MTAAPMTMLDGATLCALHGLAVVPVWSAIDGRCTCPKGAACQSPGKHPIPDNWPNVGTTDQTTIRHWLSNGYAGCNIGVVAGLSGVVNLDIDLPRPKNGMTDGRLVRAQLEAELGPLPRTVEADTGSGAEHLLFRDPGVDLVGKLGKAIDVLRGGKQFLVEPSVHASGNLYRWRAGHAPHEHAIADLPPAWVEYLRQPEPKAQPTTSTRAAGEGFYDALGSQDQRYVLECVSGSWLVNGEKLAFKRTARGKWNLFVDKGNGWESTSNFIDEDGKIAARSSGKDDGGPLASHWLRWYGHDDKRIRAGLMEFVPELARWQQERHINLDWRERGMTVVDGSDPDRVETPADPWKQSLAQALADVRAKLGATVSERTPLFFDARELFARDYQSASWLVYGLMTMGGIALEGGEPKAAIKTWSATEIAIAIVTGTKAFGEFIAKDGVVFYFYAEDADRQVRNRIRALLAGRGLDHTALDGRLFCCPRGQFIDVTKDEDLAWIVASVRKAGGKIDLLVLDPLRDISSAAEDKSDEMGPVMRRLRLLGELLGCTVLVVHHVGKQNENSAKRRPGQRLRGSSAIHGSVDSGIYVSEADGDGTSTFRNVIDSEVKGARSAGRFGLELVLVDDENGEAVKATWRFSRDVVKATAQSTARSAAMNGDEAVALAFIRMLASRGEAFSRRALRDHDERPVAVSEKRFRDAVERLLEVGSLRLEGSKVIVNCSVTEGDSNE